MSITRVRKGGREGGRDGVVGNNTYEGTNHSYFFRFPYHHHHHHRRGVKSGDEAASSCASLFFGCVEQEMDLTHAKEEERELLRRMEWATNA